MTEGASTDFKNKSVGFGTNSGFSIAVKPVGTKYLLSIGISKYNEEAKTLNNPGKDARALADVLNRLYGFNSENTTVWTNDDGFPATDLTQTALTNDLVRFAKKIKTSADADDAALVVFISGHGLQDEENNGYLFCQDGGSDNVAEVNLPVSTILQKLMGCCGQVLLILDTCYSGAGVEAAYQEALFSKDLEQYNRNFYVLAAGRSKEKVPDESEFFANLMDALEKVQAFNAFSQFQGDLQMRPQTKSLLTAFQKEGDVRRAFFLQRADPLAPFLKNAFFELVAQLQPDKLKPFRPKPINLIYLNGTVKCGHHLFAKVLFNQLRKEQVELPYFLKNKFVLGPHEAGNPEKRLWQRFSQVLLDSDDGTSESVTQKLVEDLKSEDYRIVVFSLQNDNTTFDDVFFKTWEEINHGLDGKKPEEFKGALFVLIFDERGCAVKEDGSWSNRMSFQKFKNSPERPMAYLLEFAPITPLAFDDYDNWAYTTCEDFEREKLPLEELEKIKFDTANKFETAIPPSDRYLQLAIRRICDLLGNRINVYEDLFFTNDIPESPSATPKTATP